MIDNDEILLSLVSTREVALELDVTGEYVTRLYRSGAIPARQIGREWVTTRSALNDYKAGKGGINTDPASLQEDARRIGQEIDRLLTRAEENGVYSVKEYLERNRPKSRRSD